MIFENIHTISKTHKAWNGQMLGAQFNYRKRSTWIIRKRNMKVLSKLKWSCTIYALRDDKKIKNETKELAAMRVGEKM